MVVDIVYDDEMSWLLVFAVRRGWRSPRVCQTVADTLIGTCT